MLSRTPSGIRNIHLFYRSQYLVIVEGEDDKPFWSKFFPKEVNGYKLKFEVVGGCGQINNYVKEIFASNAYFIVALDSDYRLPMQLLNNHSRILETEYYSIENLMLCPAVIASVISDHSCDTDYDVSEVESWMCHFDEKIQILMIADYLGQLNHLGVKCMGDNCSRFLIKPHVSEFDDMKIASYIQELGISQGDINNIAENLKQYTPRFHARGHFLFSAALCFVNQEVKKICGRKNFIAGDAFQTLIVKLFKQCCCNDPQVQRLCMQAEVAAQEVVKLISIKSN